MIKFLLALFFLLGCPNKPAVEDKIFNDGVVKSVARYEINFAPEMANLAPSFPLAIGSSLEFKEKLANGNLLFTALPTGVQITL